MSLEYINSEKFNSNSNNYNIVIVSKDQIEYVMSNLKFEKRAHLLIISDEPLNINEKWSVIMQQKMNGNHFVLIKKVHSKFILVKNIQITKLFSFFR